MNSVCVTGRLGKDPEVRFTQGGTAIATFSIAIPNRKKEGKEWVDHPCWIGVKLFDAQAKNAGEYLHKGDEVGIAGRLELEEWKGKDGVEHSMHVIYAHQVDYLRKKDGSTGSGKPATRSEKQMPTTNDSGGGGEGGGEGGFIDDDLPF